MACACLLRLSAAAVCCASTCWPFIVEDLDVKKSCLVQLFSCQQDQRSRVPYLVRLPFLTTHLETYKILKTSSFANHFWHLFQVY